MPDSPVGMGAMRLDLVDRAAGDIGEGRAVLEAAFDAGVNLIDTAHAYEAGGGGLGSNERLIGAVWREGVEVVTKIGMLRPGGRWVTDAKRKTLLAQAEASCEALGRVPDAMLLHAPDPRVPIATSARALKTILSRGWAKTVGVSNVSMAALEAVLEIVELGYVELAIGPRHEEAVRAGVVERCLQRGIRVLAHSPLGGPQKAGRLGKDSHLARLAKDRETTAGTLVLAWLRDLHPGLIPIPGATRVQTARAAAEAASLEVDDVVREVLDARFAIGPLLRTPRASRRVIHSEAEVALLMGIPGAGKSTAARRWAERGYVRLNRDERGGTLAGVAKALGQRLAAGDKRIVLDNTYPTRAARNLALETAWAHGARVRCVWFDTSLADAQINAVERMLEAHERLLGPEEMKEAIKRDPGVIPPRAQFRFRDALEPPADDEGFVSIERIEFARRPTMRTRAGLICDVGALTRVSEDESRPVLVLAWCPGAPEEAERLRARLPANWSLGVCVHPAGPPICWCRRPLPGLVLEWMRREQIDPAQSSYLATSAADVTLAERLGIEVERV